MITTRHGTFYQSYKQTQIWKQAKRLEKLKILNLANYYLTRPTKYITDIQKSFPDKIACNYYVKQDYLNGFITKETLKKYYKEVYK